MPSACSQCDCCADSCCMFAGMTLTCLWSCTLMISRRTQGSASTVSAGSCARQLLQVYGLLAVEMQRTLPSPRGGGGCGRAFPGFLSTEWRSRGGSWSGTYQAGCGCRNLSWDSNLTSKYVAACSRHGKQQLQLLPWHFCCGVEAVPFLVPAGDRRKEVITGPASSLGICMSRPACVVGCVRFEDGLHQRGFQRTRSTSNGTCDEQLVCCCFWCCCLTDQSVPGCVWCSSRGGVAPACAAAHHSACQGQAARRRPSTVQGHVAGVLH
jgi:hypothetical protein